MLWEAWLDLHATRSYSMGDPQGLTYCEIEAWQRLMKTELQPSEIRTLQALDMAYRDMRAAEASKPSAGDDDDDG